jgi:hypothetical protein
MTLSAFINVSQHALASTVNIEWSTSGRIPKSCRGNADAVSQFCASDWLKQSKPLAVEIPRHVNGQSASTNWICWRGDNRWINKRLKEYLPVGVKDSCQLYKSRLCSSCSRVYSSTAGQFLLFLPWSFTLVSQWQISKSTLHTTSLVTIPEMTCGLLLMGMVSLRGCHPSNLGDWSVD